MKTQTLPEPLPEGEVLLWAGAPDWRVLCKRALHVRALVLYVAALAVWGAVSHAGEGAGSVAATLVRNLALGAVPVAIAVVYAWATARATTYAITSHRVVMRIGVAVPVSLNLPFAEIGAADLRTYADASGQISLTLTGRRRVPFVVLWPHVRPWRLLRAQPALQGLKDARAVAQVLGRALAASSDMPARTLAEDRPAPTRETAEALA